MVTVLTKHRLVYNRYIVHLCLFQVGNLFLFCYGVDAIAMTSVCTMLGMGFTILVKAVVTVNTDPVHLSAPAYFFLTYNRNVVLYVTGYNTRTTTGTGIQVDRHYPAVTWFLKFIP
ncbi:hypothetical protein D3C87_1656860 [compost metagenome]